MQQDKLGSANEWSVSGGNRLWVFGCLGGRERMPTPEQSDGSDPAKDRRRVDKILPLHHYQRKLKAERRTDAAETRKNCK